MALHCRHEYLSLFSLFLSPFFIELRLHKRSHKFPRTVMCVYVCARVLAYSLARACPHAWYRRRKIRRTIFLRAVMRYPADCLQRTFLSRATNKNASPTDIEKSLGAITAEIYAGYSLVCLTCVRARVRTRARTRVRARYAYRRRFNYSSLLFGIREIPWSLCAWRIQENKCYRVVSIMIRAKMFASLTGNLIK